MGLTLSIGKGCVILNVVKYLYTHPRERFFTAFRMTVFMVAVHLRHCRGEQCSPAIAHFDTRIFSIHSTSRANTVRPYLISIFMPMFKGDLLRIPTLLCFYLKYLTPASNIFWFLFPQIFFAIFSPILSE
ncbi:MAG: hypothetical protein K0R09_730 [Clostridiales bacterium]|nr:hypothetical protein [Clostridiales bacterium]